MYELINAIIVLIVIANFLLLGAGWLKSSIRIVAFQGLTLGMLPLLVHQDGFSVRLSIIAILVITLKGIIFPRLLMRSLRELSSVREVTYYVGPMLSLFIGILVMSSSLWWGYTLPFPDQGGYRLAIPMVFFTIVTGLFLIVSRRQALMQIIGYLTLENGIYAFGVFYAQSESMLIEIGILLDIFVAVFIMGIMVFHISREFDNIEAGQLSTLKDWLKSRKESLSRDQESK